MVALDIEMVPMVKHNICLF